MKKKILIVILMLLIIVIGVVIANKVFLNNNEKEVLSVLKDLDYSLQNPKNTEEGTINLRPTEPITLKEYIHTISEVRKINTENGNLTFLIKAVLAENYETILVVSNGELISMTINDELLEIIDKNTESNDNWSDNLISIFQKSFISKTNELILEKWNNATVLDNVNFAKVLNKI